MVSGRRHGISRLLVRTLIVVLSIVVLIALGLLAYHTSGFLAVMLAQLRQA
jgi:phage shock protein PspC (stress-responsive transcriptional regulator)